MKIRYFSSAAIDFLFHVPLMTFKKHAIRPVAFKNHSAKKGQQGFAGSRVKLTAITPLTFRSCSALSSIAACFKSFIRYSTLVCKCLSWGFNVPGGRIQKRKKKPIYVIRVRLMISVFGKIRENGRWPCDFVMLLGKTLQPPTFSFCPANCQRNLMNFWEGERGRVL